MNPLLFAEGAIQLANLISAFTAMAGEIKTVAGSPEADAVANALPQLEAANTALYARTQAMLAEAAKG